MGITYKKCVLMVEDFILWVKPHGCQNMVIFSVHGSYHQMAKQPHMNFKVKVFSNNNIVNIVNYIRGTEKSKVNY